MWRFAAFSVLMDESSAGGRGEYVGAATIILMTGSYVVLALISFIRGHRIGKPWLVAFPIIGGIFDVVLVIVPFVPTVMHLLTLILGSITPEASKSTEK